MLSYKTHKSKRSLHKEDHIYRWELKPRILLCSLFEQFLKKKKKKCFIEELTLKAWCARVTYVNVKGADLGAFRYVFGIHMLHKIVSPGAEFLLWHLISAILLYFFFLFVFPCTFFFCLLYYIEFQSV